MIDGKMKFLNFISLSFRYADTDITKCLQVTSCFARKAYDLHPFSSSCLSGLWHPVNEMHWERNWLRSFKERCRPYRFRISLPLIRLISMTKIRAITSRNSRGLSVIHRMFFGGSVPLAMRKIEKEEQKKEKQKYPLKVAV